MARHFRPAHYLLKIQSYSLLCETGVEKYDSGVFEVGGHKWWILMPQYSLFLKIWIWALLSTMSSFVGGCLSIQKEMRKWMGLVTSPFICQLLIQKNLLWDGRLMPASNCLCMIRYGTSSWAFKVCSLIIYTYA